MPEYSLDLEITPPSPYTFEVSIGFPGPKGVKGDVGTTNFAELINVPATFPPEIHYHNALTTPAGVVAVEVDDGSAGGGRRHIHLKNEIWIGFGHATLNNGGGEDGMGVAGQVVLFGLVNSRLQSATKVTLGLGDAVEGQSTNDDLEVNADNVILRKPLLTGAHRPLCTASGEPTAQNLITRADADSLYGTSIVEITAADYAALTLAEQEDYTKIYAIIG